MKAILKTYINQEMYEKDYPYKVEKKDSIGQAVETAKEEVRKYRNTNNFIGFKVFNTKEVLIHKLPSY